MRVMEEHPEGLTEQELCEKSTERLLARAERTVPTKKATEAKLQVLFLAAKGINRPDYLHAGAKGTRQ